jgi:hypothetical protein
VYGWNYSSLQRKVRFVFTDPEAVKRRIDELERALSEVRVRRKTLATEEKLKRVHERMEKKNRKKFQKTGS